jgi:hypothetical protein
MKRLFCSEINRMAARGLAVSLLSAVGIISAQDLPPAAMEKIRRLSAAKLALSFEEQKLESNLYEAVQKMKGAGITRENAARRAVKITFPTPLLEIDASARLHLILRTTEITPALLSQLAALEFEVEATTANLPVTSNHQMISGWVPYDRIDDIAKLSPIFHIRPVDRPIAMTMAASGEVTSAGDAILRANVARSTFGVDGNGQKVGVLSLGVDHLANSQASADLPAMVEVINNRSRGDEGTAMLEIVHDLAPGAKLAYADAGSSQMDFANNINLLRALGCTVICDNIIYLLEPVYEDGIIAQTIDEVVNINNVVYTSAAGDWQLNHYEIDFRDDDQDSIHNFGPGDETFNMDLLANSTMQVMLQWNNQFGKAKDNYDLYLFGANTKDTLSISTNIQNGSDDPYEMVTYTNPNNSTIGVRVVVRKQAGEARRFTLFILGAGVTRFEPYLISDGVIFGHSGAQSCLAAGAISASDPSNDDIEPFSGHGPTRIYSYNADGNPINFVDRLKPDHAAIDGVETKVGRVGFFSNPFIGTSAATAHTAGIAALVRQGRPSLLANEIGELMNRTAIDLGAAGFDKVFGNGRIDALNALRAPSVTTNAATNITPTSVLLNGTANPNGLTTTVKFQFGLTMGYGSEIAATPSPVTGTSAVPVSATVTGLSPKTAYNYRVVATNSVGTTNGANQTFTTLPVPPSIAHTSPITQPEGQPITIDANITDDVGIASVELRYRRGGEASFTSTPMTLVSGSTYRGTIPAGVVDSRGVEYFIVATDLDNAQARRPVFPNIFSISIQVSKISNPTIQPSGSAATDYRLISVPLRLSDSSATAVLIDNLGAYDNAKWRLYDLGTRLPVSNKTPYIEVSQTGFFTPGKSLFLIVRDPNQRIDAGPGQSVKTDQEFRIALEPGHNFVATPFNFTIPASKLRLKSGGVITATTLQTYDQNWIRSDRLSPWEGYYLANNNATRDTLFVNPNLSPPIAANKTYIGGPMPLSGWRLRILASCAEARDDYNFAGLTRESEDVYDDNDLAEPPPIGEYVSVYFPHPEWQKPLSRFSDDMRSASNPNQKWRFVVESNITNEMVTLRFDGLKEIDAASAVFLVDEALQYKQNLRENAVYSYQPRRRESAKEFTLIVGKEDFISEQTATAQGAPENFVLEQNFPNPFNPETAIRFGLPQTSVVTIKIFDLAGHEVTTLLDRVELPAGRHQRVWDGRDAQGRAVVSGIYFCRLAAGSFAKTVKLTVMR